MSQPMNWSEEDLKAKGFAVRPDGRWTKHHPDADRLPDPEPEQYRLPALEDEGEGQESGVESPDALYRITITRYGTRWLDEDNLAGGTKSLVDALRASGLIPEDDPTKTSINWEQRKVAKRSSTRTVIEIKKNPTERNQ